MEPERILPEDPIAFIRECLLREQDIWTYHALVRLKSRSVSRDEAIRSVATSAEVIEEYPQDKYLPSYLILSGGRSGPLHLVVGVDVAGQNVRIVTVYRPDPDEWEPDMRTRR